MSLPRPPSRHALPVRPAVTPALPVASAVDPVPASAARGTDQTQAAQPAGSAPPPASAGPADRAAADLLTTKEAAAVLRVAHKRLERWRMTGDGPVYVRMTAKSIVYRRADIDAFITARLRANTAA